MYCLRLHLVSPLSEHQHALGAVEVVHSRLLVEIAELLLVFTYLVVIQRVGCMVDDVPRLIGSSNVGAVLCICLAVGTHRSFIVTAELHHISSWHMKHLYRLTFLRRQNAQALAALRLGAALSIVLKGQIVPRAERTHRTGHFLHGKSPSVPHISPQISVFELYKESQSHFSPKRLIVAISYTMAELVTTPEQSKTKKPQRVGDHA